MSPRPSPAPARPPQLPEELIFCSILPRLPVRSLARLTAVCKAWRDLILFDAAFAAMQAQSPSPASSALARFRNGRLEIIGADGTAAASVAPPDPRLSFLTVGSSGHHYKVLDICACTAGLLCLTAVQVETQRRVLCICNPATERVHWIWYDCKPGVAGLAYDPAAAAERGYDVVVAAKDGWEACRFYWFSSRAAGSGWRTTRVLD